MAETRSPLVALSRLGGAALTPADPSAAAADDEPRRDVAHIQRMLMAGRAATASYHAEAARAKHEASAEDKVWGGLGFAVGAGREGG